MIYSNFHKLKVAIVLPWSSRAHCWFYVCVCVQYGACFCVRNWTARHAVVFSSMVTCHPQVET